MNYSETSVTSFTPVDSGVVEFTNDENGSVVLRVPLVGWGIVVVELDRDVDEAGHVYATATTEPRPFVLDADWGVVDAFSVARRLGRPISPYVSLGRTPDGPNAAEYAYEITNPDERTSK
ncbi:hypothetical protein [Mobilicoccus sp.]|uniref:hypothetical protein n=1 Tax=Mobilicoccus sp. TaxID=2034349 RepID=UPI0028A8F282|nr:hypothetical protein [Mobilicoccus sp.]